MKKYRNLINIGLLITILSLTAYLFYEVFTSDIALNIRNYIAIIFLVILIFSLFLNKNIFNLILGINLLIGNFAGLSSFGEITTSSFIFNIGSLPIPST